MNAEAVGIIIGFIFGIIYTSCPKTWKSTHQCTGSVNIIRFGAGPSGLMRTLGQYMLGSGATFGFVVSFEAVVDWVTDHWGIC